MLLCSYDWGDQNKDRGICDKYGGEQKYIEGCDGKNCSRVKCGKT